MNYEQVQKLSGEDFRRLTGVKRETFKQMSEILTEEDEKRRKNHKYRGGRNPALSIENKLLLVFAYLREYSSMFHTAQKFGVSKAVSDELFEQAQVALKELGKVGKISRKLQAIIAAKKFGQKSWNFNGF